MTGPASPGWVYVLTNPAYPNLVKIGMTTRNPTARAAELSSASGVLAPFTVHWAVPVTNCAAVETAVHRMMGDRRERRGREFFRADPATARHVIEAAAGALIRKRRFWRSSPYATRPAKERRPFRRSGGGGDVAAFGLIIVVIAGIGYFRPSLPAWTPAPVAAAFAVIEQHTPRF